MIVHTSKNKTLFEICFGYLRPSSFDYGFGYQRDKEDSILKE